MSKRPTVEVREQIVKYIKSGIPFESACRVVLGRKWQDAAQWLAIGAGLDPKYIRVPKAYRDFHDAVVRAEAAAETRFVLALTSAAVGGAVISETIAPDGTRRTKKAPPKARWALEWLARQRREGWRPPTQKKEITKLELAAQIKAMHARGYDPREFPEDNPILLPNGRVIPVNHSQLPEADDDPPYSESEIEERNAGAMVPGSEDA